MSDSEMTMKEILDFFTPFINSLSKRDNIGSLRYLKSFINKQSSISKEKKTQFNEGIDKAIPVIEELELRRKLIFKDPTEFLRNILSAVNYTRSHIEYFFSHIHRLVHIKNEGNRDYENEYFQHGSKKFYIGRFKGMCKEELKDFEALQSFLIQYSKKLKKLRDVNAHQVPEKIRLSEDHMRIIIPRVNKPDYEIYHHQLCHTIISYALFINKIDLHPKSPYDTSEDAFFILKF